MGVSVKINEKDMFSEFGCVLTGFTIGNPAPQTKLVQVPLRNGSIDLTESLTGNVRYNDREITMSFLYQGTGFEDKFSEISNEYHGKSVQILFDRDLGYFYKGRAEIGGFSHEKYGGTFTITAICQPFKISVNSSGEPWLWDPFSFIDGYINDFYNLEVSGSKTIKLITDSNGFASITTDAQITVTFGTKSVVCGVGTTTLYDFNFVPNAENEITITGNATVTLNYRGEKL